MSTSVLIRHPLFGSLWLHNAEWTADSVEGETWDDTDVGSSNMPDDYHGEPALMNFPQTCVDRVRIERSS